MIAHGRRMGVPARSLNRLILIAVGRFGLPMPRVMVLRVHGRRSGRLRTVPLLVGRHAGARILVAPRGTTDWALNLRAAGWGELMRGRHIARVHAVELHGEQRVDALAAYIASYGWMTRRLFGLPRRPSRERLVQIAPHHPVFRLEQRERMAP